MDFFDWYDWIKKAQTVYERLQDDESRRIFDARFSFMKNRSAKEWSQTIGLYYNDWRYNKCLDIFDHIVIWGAGHDGYADYWYLKTWGKEISAFCDQRVSGQIEGVEILKPEEAISRYPDALYIVGSSRFKNEIMVEMEQLGIPEKNIFNPPFRYIRAYRGWQYFDMFEPKDDEVFVDAGTYTGDTLNDFLKYTKGKFIKAYGMEPIPLAFQKAQERFADDDRIKVLNYASWNRKEELTFSDEKMASCQDERGSLKVMGMDIDTVTRNDKVTFIKMDVEGAELKALQGAQKQIENNHPRLAICVYHHLLDFVDLGYFILEKNPDYKLWYRHYQSCDGETVLYASDDK